MAPVVSEINEVDDVSVVDAGSGEVDEVGAGALLVVSVDPELGVGV
jgi:hypothetical protein